MRKGRVFQCDGSAFFNRPGPRLVESLEILAEILHPEKFQFGHEGRGEHVIETEVLGRTRRHDARGARGAGVDEAELEP